MGFQGFQENVVKKIAMRLLHMLQQALNRNSDGFQGGIPSKAISFQEKFKNKWTRAQKRRGQRIIRQAEW